MIIRSVFISGASDDFSGLRALVASDLRSKGIQVKEQSDFRQGGATLMDQLFDYIDICDAVVALQGQAAGSMPSERQCLDCFGLCHLNSFDELTEECGIPSHLMPLSYTQWEVAYALGFRLGRKRAPAKPVHLYFTQALANEIHRTLPTSTDSLQPWAAFGVWLYHLGISHNNFQDDPTLRMLVFFDLTPNLGRTPESTGLQGMLMPLRVRTTTHQGQWESAWDLGNAIYKSLGLGTMYPAKDHALKWWRQFNRGAIGVVDYTEKLWGYLSVWPLTHDAFDGIKSAAIGEDELSPEHILPDPDYLDGQPRPPQHRLRSQMSGGYTYWYVADLCLATHDRAKWGPLRMPFNLMKPGTFRPFIARIWEFMVKFLLYESFAYLAEHQLLGQNVVIVAFGESPFGRKWLELCGFECHAESLSKYGSPVYLRSVTQARLCEEIVEFRRSAAYLQGMASLQQALASYHASVKHGSGSH